MGIKVGDVIAHRFEVPVLDVLATHHFVETFVEHVVACDTHAPVIAALTLLDLLRSPEDLWHWDATRTAVILVK
jgi:hypothetical protein